MAGGDCCFSAFSIAELTEASIFSDRFYVYTFIMVGAWTGGLGNCSSCISHKDLRSFSIVFMHSAMLSSRYWRSFECS